MVRSDFSAQFRGDSFPQESYGPTRIPLYREAASPSVKGRQGIGLGSQAEAYPGMIGKQSFGTRKE